MRFKWVTMPVRAGRGVLMCAMACVCFYEGRRAFVCAKREGVSHAYVHRLNFYSPCDVQS